MTRKPLREVTVPSGYTISDYGKGRGGGYWINGEKVDGVTTVLGIIDGGKSGGMAYSAGRIWLAGICQLVADGQRFDWHDPETAEAVLKDHKLLHIHKWGSKTDLGSATHDALEALCEGTVPTLPDDDTRPYIQALCAWYSDNDPHVVHSELMVGSAVHGYAGRFDLLYEQNDQLVLADLKTSRDVQPTHLIQLAAYALAMGECGYGYPNRLEVIHARPDGSYTVTPSTAVAKDFLDILAAYRAYHVNKDALKAA